MKTTTTRFIDERVVRHIAREHYNMTYFQEVAMQDKNKGKVKWPWVVFAIVMTLFFAIIPFMLNGKNRMVVSIFSVGFGPGFLYCAVMLCIQEYKHNKWWKEIRHEIVRFKRMIECPIDSSPPWDELLASAKEILERLGTEIVHLNAHAAFAQNELRRSLRAMGLEEGVEENVTEAVVEEHHIYCLRGSLDIAMSKAEKVKKEFEKLFELAKYVLGNPLDNGHGFGAFMGKITAAERLKNAELKQ